MLFVLLIACPSLYSARFINSGIALIQGSPVTLLDIETLYIVGHVLENKTCPKRLTFVDVKSSDPNVRAMVFRLILSLEARDLNVDVEGNIDTSNYVNKIKSCLGKNGHKITDTNYIERFVSNYKMSEAFLKLREKNIPFQKLSAQYWAFQRSNQPLDVLKPTDGTQNVWIPVIALKYKVELL